MKDLSPIERLEMGAYATAAFCGLVAPALAPSHPIISALVAGTGAGAVAIKAYLSKSPKEANPQQPNKQPS